MKFVKEGKVLGTSSNGQKEIRTDKRLGFEFRSWKEIPPSLKEALSEAGLSFAPVENFVSHPMGEGWCSFDSPTPLRKELGNGVVIYRTNGTELKIEPLREWLESLGAQIGRESWCAAATSVSNGGSRTEYSEFLGKQVPTPEYYWNVRDCSAPSMTDWALHCLDLIDLTMGV